MLMKSYYYGNGRNSGEKKKRRSDIAKGLISIVYPVMIPMRTCTIGFHRISNLTCTSLRFTVLHVRNLQ